MDWNNGQLVRIYIAPFIDSEDTPILVKKQLLFGNFSVVTDQPTIYHLAH